MVSGSDLVHVYHPGYLEARAFVGTAKGTRPARPVDTVREIL